MDFTLTLTSFGFVWCMFFLKSKQNWTVNIALREWKKNYVPIHIKDLFLKMKHVKKSKQAAFFFRLLRKKRHSQLTKYRKKYNIMFTNVRGRPLSSKFQRTHKLFSIHAIDEYHFDSLRRKKKLLLNLYIFKVKIWFFFLFLPSILLYFTFSRHTCHFGFETS